MQGHGKTLFNWDNNILYVEAFGPFNEEGIVDAADSYQNAIIDRTSDLFSIIEIWDAECLGSPQTISEVGKHWSILSRNGCISLAIVVANGVQKSIVKSRLPEIGKVFSDKEDAIQWLQQKLNS